MSSNLNEANLEKKFHNVTNTQDSIQTLSLWILHHKAHHKRIAEIWLKCLKKAKSSNRLAMLYLANDVIQNCKRKGANQFNESFQSVLKAAAALLKDEQIRAPVDRVFTIWESRNVYSASFVADLRKELSQKEIEAPSHRSSLVKKKEQVTTKVASPSAFLADFKCQRVIEKIRKVMKLEVETATVLASVNISKLSATNAEMLRKLKDRNHGQRYAKEFDEATRCLQNYIHAVEKEIRERAGLIELLEQSEMYYDSQRGEAKIVANAYRNFGSRVKALQKKLEELMATFPSPVSSPCLDAPSPTNSDADADPLPNEDVPISEEEHPILPEENAPSPDGSPEDLHLDSPVVPVTTAVQASVNQMPLLATFFPQNPGMMTSWLGAFTTRSSTESKPNIEPNNKVSESNSLDSRLSSFMQNIPTMSVLPTELHGTIFGSHSGGSTPIKENLNSPSSFSKSIFESTKNNGLSVAEASTPVKDEDSGQNTPVQDEDNPSSNNFFNSLPAFSNSLQTSQGIFKELSLESFSSVLPKKSSQNPTKSYANNQNNNWPLEANKEENVSTAAISEILKKISPVVQGSPHSLSPHNWNDSSHNNVSPNVDNAKHPSLLLTTSLWTPTITTTSESEPSLYAQDENNLTTVTYSYSETSISHCDYSNTSNREPDLTYKYSVLENNSGQMESSPVYSTSACGKRMDVTDTTSSLNFVCSTRETNSNVSEIVVDQPHGLPIRSLAKEVPKSGHTSSPAHHEAYDPERENFEPIDMDLGDSDQEHGTSEISPAKGNASSPDPEEWDFDAKSEQNNKSVLVDVTSSLPLATSRKLRTELKFNVERTLSENPLSFSEDGNFSQPSDVDNRKAIKRFSQSSDIDIRISDEKNVSQSSDIDTHMHGERRLSFSSECDTFLADKRKYAQSSDAESCADVYDTSWIDETPYLNTKDIKGENQVSISKVKSLGSPFKSPQVTKDKDERQTSIKLVPYEDEQQSSSDIEEEDAYENKSAQSEQHSLDEHSHNKIETVALSRIETIQSTRKDSDKRKWDDMWEDQEFIQLPSRIPQPMERNYRRDYYQRTESDYYYPQQPQHKNKQTSRWGGNNWSGRDRFSDQNRNSFKRFTSPSYRGGRTYYPPPSQY